MINAALIIS